MECLTSKESWLRDMTDAELAKRIRELARDLTFAMHIAATHDVHVELLLEINRSSYGQPPMLKIFEISKRL